MKMSDFRDVNEQNDNIDFDVIIVGAGLTGLTAAYNLLKKKVGLDVLILEATENIGGRVFMTEESKSFHAHPLQKHLVEMLDELNISIVSQRQISTSNERIFFTKSGPRRKLPAYILAQVYNFLATIQNISLDFQVNMYIDEDSILSQINLDQLTDCFLSWGTAKSISQSLLITSCGISRLKQVSTLWYLLLVNGAGGFLQRLKISLGDKKRFFIQSGMAELVKRLSNNITKMQGIIRLSESVSNIQFSDTRTYVTTSSNKCYKCEYVIIAVPPPESLEITVEPSLSPKFKKVQSLFENGKNLFFTATFSQEFRNDNYNYPLNIITTPDCESNLKLLYDATHSSNKSQQVLAGFLDESTFQTRRKFRFFNTLNKCFRGNAAQNCIDYKERKWMPFNLSNKESIRGGSPMSFLNPCDFQNYFNPLSIRNGRIFYAASEYAKCWPGTVDGAIEAGKITSLSILWQMRPQSLNKSDLSFFSIRPKKFRQMTIRFALIYYMCLATNICIFWSFLRKAY